MSTLSRTGALAASHIGCAKTSRLTKSGWAFGSRRSVRPAAGNRSRSLPRSMIILMQPMWLATCPAQASECQTGSIRGAGKTDGRDVLESAPTDGGSAGHGTVLAMCPQVDPLTLLHPPTVAQRPVLL